MNDLPQKIAVDTVVIYDGFVDDNDETSTLSAMVEESGKETVVSHSSS